MIRPPAGRELVWGSVCGLVALGLVVALLGRHRESLERANGLYRDGRIETAERIYRARAEPQPAPGPATYNLGTALLALGAPEAEDYLRLAAEGGDSAVAQRGHYNLGHRLLTRFSDGAEPDSAVLLLAGAVDNNRAALRLDPGDGNARWNLALAQRMLDSLKLVDEVAAGEEEDERPEEQEGVIIPQLAQGGPPRGMEREALAGLDPGPLSEAEALGVVDLIAPDAEALIRGILWSHRPDVDPWAEPYPGGNR